MIPRKSAVNSRSSEESSHPEPGIGARRNKENKARPTIAGLFILAVIRAIRARSDDSDDFVIGLCSKAQ